MFSQSQAVPMEQDLKLAPYCNQNCFWLGLGFQLRCEPHSAPVTSIDGIAVFEAASDIWGIVR